jgi:Carboxypeptidase regulatory-like domain
VPKAKLHVRMVGANPTGRIIFYWADAEGNFSIEGLAFGVYDIFVSKEEDGFPDTDFFFYSSKQTSVPQVAVTKQQPPPFVTVPIGPKAGRITGRVANAVTGAPIGNATMTFSRPENKFMVLTTSLNQPDDRGAFNFLLPAAPLTIKVTAPGYAVWNYRNEGSKQADLLTLEPGKTKELVVRMRRLR